ncbi:MAG: SEL1-like repeat protein [Pseudomonadota bacterium]
MANLGILFRDGRGGPRDVERARSLLTVAVTMGVDEAVPILRSLGE